MHPVSRRCVSARYVHKNYAETKCIIAVFVTVMLQKYPGIPYNVSHFLRDILNALSMLNVHMRSQGVLL